MTNTIETYLDSLSEDISILNINFKKLYFPILMHNYLYLI